MKLLELRLDPAGRNLAAFIDTAVAAALAAFTEKEWLRRFSELAEAMASVGPSHRCCAVLCCAVLCRAVLCCVP